MFERIEQPQFEQILDLLILYKQLNPKKTVSLTEKSILEAINFMRTSGQDFASQLGMSN